MPLTIPTMTMKELVYVVAMILESTLSFMFIMSVNIKFSKHQTLLTFNYLLYAFLEF